MKYLTLKLTIVFLPIFAILSGLIVAVGELQPTSTALKGFVQSCNGKSPRCWYGIVPGETEFEAVPTLVAQQGISAWPDAFSNFQKYFISGDLGCQEIKIAKDEQKSTVEQVEFYNCVHLQVDDLLFLMEYPGELNKQWYCPNASAWLLYPTSYIWLKGIPDAYGSNDVISFGIRERAYKSLDELKNMLSEDNIYTSTIDYTEWKFFRVALVHDPHACG